MPTLYQLKPRFQQLLRPLLGALHRRGISANFVTTSALLASIVFGLAMAYWPGVNAPGALARLPWLLLPLFLLLRMALNAIDGMLAREFNQQTPLGMILNECGDVISDVALYAPFALLPGVNAGLLMLVLFLAILTEFVGVLGQQVGGIRRYDGPIGKSDRAFVFGALALLYGLDWFSGALWNPVLLLLALLLACTVVLRIRRALQSGATH
jgi:CDP-diacylglycerol---glycerol-3-phosphate 3-phosphatidyltransferase